MFKHIDADSNTLMRQAVMTAHDYMHGAINDIDELLGKGYAKSHPELIGAFIQTASIDLAGVTIARAIQDGLEGVAEAIQHLGRGGGE